MPTNFDRIIDVLNKTTLYVIALNDNIDKHHDIVENYRSKLDSSINVHNMDAYNKTMSTIERLEQQLDISINSALTLTTEFKKILGKLKKEKTNSVLLTRQYNRIYHSSFGTLTGQLTNKVKGNIDRKNLTMKQKQALIHVGALTPSPDM